VGAETRARLEALFAEVGYSASMQAQQLASGRSRLIGVVFPLEISQIVLHPVYPALLGAVGDAAAERGYALLLATTSGHLSQTVDVLTRHRVHGVILPAAGPGDPLLPALSELGAAVVLIGHRTDHDVASYWLTRRLIEQGRKRLVHLAGPREVSACVLRAQGFDQAVAESDSEIEWARVEWTRFDSVEAAARAHAILTDPGGPPDAVVCGSDFIAAGVLLAARELGVGVPDQLGVTGFDNLDLAAHTSPTLTSVRMPLKELGPAAVSLLLDDLSPRSVLLQTEILYRESTETARRRSVPASSPKIKLGTVT
jgi:LacI family transcriptional regulator